MGVNGVTTPSSEVASRFDLRKRAGEAKVRERGGGRGGGIGVPQSRPRAGAEGRNVPYGMDTNVFIRNIDQLGRQQSRHSDRAWHLAAPQPLRG